MRAVVDSSTWISLARSGLLPLLGQVDLEPVVPAVVHDECVRAGLAGGHADAAAIESVLERLEVVGTAAEPDSADAAVLHAARDVGALVTNDLALGRRARSLGVAWLRTADLVVWAVRTTGMSAEAGRRAIQTLTTAGRLGDELAQDYLEELT
ncbi:MAG TPA: hypothetical protein VFD41_07130 [Actinomycetales bacterium]|nr:hypothetical protein [Actinomycetales bacterium]